MPSVRRLAFLLIIISLGFSAPTPFPIPRQESMPGIRDLALSPAGDEAYFTLQSLLGERSILMRMERGWCGWKIPEPMIHSGQYNDLEPFLTQDGLQLYFISDRPTHPDSSRAKDYDIWMMTRKDMDGAWDAPVNLGPSVNTDHNEFYPSLSNNGNLYFCSDRPSSRGKDDIFMAPRLQDDWGQVVNLGDSINTAGPEFNAFVDPQERYILFSAWGRQDSHGSGDLYISYHRGDHWSAPENLGPDINGPRMDYCPLMHDGRLYFTSRRSTIPRSGTPIPAQDILTIFNQHENGESRLYWVSFQPHR